VKRRGPEGVAIIDKPLGRTSHDVVQAVRRRLGQRRVGHAGTLDPLATGVLVVMVGEATKLAPFLTADDKRYRATVRFGASTDTLDAEGRVIAEATLPAGWSERAPFEEVLAAERARSEQAPPVFSAIKVGGRAAHARTRAGEEVHLAPRPVAVRSLSIVAIEPDAIVLDLAVSKGYYVRALARDLGEALGVPSHLAALRRTASGAFGLDRAVPLEEVSEEALLSIEEAAATSLPTAVLSDEGARRAGHGSALGPDDFERPPPEGVAAFLHGGRLVAVGERRDDQVRVLRGFS
jgi:tRNA pseudouridine55 synthase